jgi:DNA-binding response OmpR family regulator
MPVDLSAIREDQRLPNHGDTVPAAPVQDRSATSAASDIEALADVPILVVDDDQPSARLLRVLLGAAGGQVRTAHDAEEALSVLAGFSARLIVVDLILPGISGLLLARRIKDTSPETVIVAVSVAHGPDVERHALSSGCATLLHKPIDVNTFVQTVTRLLRRWG